MNAITQLSSAQLSLRHKPPDDTGPCQMQSITTQTPTRLQLFAQQRIAPLDVCTDGGAQTEVQHTLPSPIVSSPVTGTGPSGWGSITEHILEYILSALRDEQGRWPSRKVRPNMYLSDVCVSYLRLYASALIGHRIKRRVQLGYAA